MTLDQLVAVLRQKHVRLWVEGEKLRYEAPREAMTEELLAALKTHKAELLQVLQRAQQAGDALPQPIQRMSREEPLPLSFTQQRLWLLDQLEPNLATYNIPHAFRLTGELNQTALEQSLGEIVRRHEVFRTTFPSADGEAVQKIHSYQTIQIPVSDLSQLAAAQREIELDQALREEARRPFDLAGGPLLRAKLFRLAGHEHVFFVNIHHIVYDAWSGGVFAREFSQLYRAFAEGRPSSLPDLPIQFADFAGWQRQSMQGEVLERQLTYWKKQLADASFVLELPADHPRPPKQTYRGAQVSLQLPKELSRDLEELARREGATLFMTLMAAFQVLLYRYTGQEDISVGSPIAGRTQTETEPLIGFFINMLVIRGNLSGNPSFRELLRRTKETALGAYSNQEVTFEKLVEELHPARDMSRSPLFQTMFILQNAPSHLIDLPKITVSDIPLDTQTSKFDLSMELMQSSDGLAGKLEYSTDLFDADRVQRMAGHFQTLLEGIVATPEEQIGLLPLLPRPERQKILLEWNQTSLDYPHGHTMHQLVEAQVEKTPDATALVAGKERLTYQQLNQRANRLARHLRTLGVGREVLVGICSERSIEMTVAMLAILKAGGAYVPLDPTYPKDRTAFILEDAGAHVLLTQEKLVSNLPAHKGKVVYLDALDTTGESADNLNVEVTAENLAYTIFTSGSTGRPKGVAIEHRNAVALIEWARSVFSQDELDGVLFSTSICFDLSVFELFVTLSCGGKVILAENALHLPSLPAVQEVRLINTVPSAIAELLRTGAIPKSVPTINLAGEPLAQSLVDKIYELPSVRKVYDLYGPSEDTTYSTFTLRQPGGVATIGRPIANTQLYILDARMQPVPVGVPGEVHLGGEGLARGYLHRPDLTAEKFIPNPFDQTPGARLYKTGDLARFRPDGNVEYIGRIDRQVKVRGFRIELGEIQAVLEQHPALAEVAVIVREDQPGEKLIVSYVTAKNGVTPGAGELRDFLRHKLPDYMIPSRFVTLKTLPLTPNGKVDRRALPAPDQAQSQKPGETVAPRDALEQQLVQLWEKIFNRGPIGIRDNFFDLGGHSLLAVRLFSQVQKLTQKNLPMVTLFEAPTIEQLAAILRKQGEETPWRCLVPIKASGSRPPFYSVHGVGGNVLEYLDLAKYMDTDQPFYGIQALGLDGKSPMQNLTVEQMAAHYIQEVRALQPKGPYYLGGSSFGGLVAYEMAQQLTAAGERIALLAFFDTNGPDYPQYLPTTTVWERKIKQWQHRFSLHWQNFLTAQGVEKLRYIGIKTQRWGNNTTAAVPRLVRRYRRRLRKKLDEYLLPEAIRNVNKAGRWAAADYRPKPYGGSVTIFRATHQAPCIVEDRTLGWGPLVQGKIEIYDTPGHHGAIVRDPRARVLSTQLSDALHKAREAAEGNPSKERKPDSNPIFASAAETNRTNGSPLQHKVTGSTGVFANH